MTKSKNLWDKMKWTRVLGVVFSFFLCAQCSARSQVSSTPAPFPVAKDLAGLVHSVPLIVVAKVAELRQGRTVGKGDAYFQFNDVRMIVEKCLKGQPPQELLVEQLANAGSSVSAEVGPAYHRGERYVLFLRTGEGNRYVTAREGRYILRKGRVYPTEPGLVADKFRDAEEAKFIVQIETAAALSNSSQGLADRARPDETPHLPTRP